MAHRFYKNWVHRFAFGSCRGFIIEPHLYLNEYSIQCANNTSWTVNTLRKGRGVVFCIEIEPASLQGLKGKHQIRLVLETVTDLEFKNVGVNHMYVIIKVCRRCRKHGQFFLPGDVINHTLETHLSPPTDVENRIIKTASPSRVSKITFELMPKTSSFPPNIYYLLPVV